ncbi:cytochrome P450 [Mucor lusitanicus]
MLNYSNLLEKYREKEALGRFVPIACAALATTVVAMYGIKTLLGNRRGEIKKYRMIPTPSGSVFYFGHKLLLGDIPAHKIAEWHKELGPILRVKMGSEDWIYVADAGMAHELFALEDNLESSSPHFICGDGIYGGKEASTKTVELLIKKTQQHGSVNPLSFIRSNAINITLATAFWTARCKILTRPFIQILDYPSIWKPWSWIKETTSMDALYAPLRRVVQRARTSDQDNMVKRIDLLKEEYVIDERDVTVITGELLVAGTMALSSATAWTLAILCHHPDYYRFPTFDDLAELPYSNALLKESLRFRLPVYFGIPRKATKDVVCRNYLIPKGSTIVGNIYAISNDNYVIQNPEKFLPERFQYDSRTLHAGANEGPEEHCAFGWQKRICPGISLAETQMFNIVTKVMSRCTIEPILPVYPNLDDVRSAGATVVPGPFKLRFVERDDRRIV